MALITWNDSYSVKVQSIDIQHKKLIDLINEFHAAMAARQTKEFMNKLFAGLIQYTATHFATEERYFKQYDYPGTDAHKKEHEAFVQKVTDMKDRFDNGRLVLSLEAMNFLKDWLINHIQGTDKKYSAFFNSKGLK